jgi:hypothetical protein
MYRPKIERYTNLYSDTLYVNFDRALGWQYIVNEVHLRKQSNGYITVYCTDGFDEFNTRFFPSIKDALGYFKTLARFYTEHSEVYSNDALKTLGVA